jgi:hypothetical protein
MTGRTPGGLLMALSFQIESPSVGRGGPPTEIRKGKALVKRLDAGAGICGNLQRFVLRTAKGPKRPLELDSDADTP